MSQGWLDLLTSAPAVPRLGVTLKDGDGPASLSAPVTLARPKVNEREMSVTCVLATARPDRQGDIVEPRGADFAEHRLNPVVLFHHGKGGHLPIGKAEDARGNYTVRLAKSRDGDDVLLGTTHFSQKNQFAQDVFALVAEDILRGVSVGFDPKDDGGRREKSVEILGDSPSLDRPAMRFKSWTLLEYSHTPIGVNREALTVAVRKAMDGSRGMDPRLLKFLTPYAAPRKTVVPVGAPVPPRVEKAMPEMEDDDAGLYPAGDGGGDDGGAVATDDQPADDRGGADVPAGVKTLLDGAQGAMDLCGQIDAAMAQSDSLELRKFAKAICADLEKLAGKVSEYAEKHHAKLTGAPDDEPEPDDESAEPDADGGEPEGPPETDEDGALVTKGGYRPRRLTFFDISGTPAPVARTQKAAPAADADEVAALRAERDALAERLELLIQDAEASARLRARRGE